MCNRSRRLSHSMLVRVAVGTGLAASLLASPNSSFAQESTHAPSTAYTAAQAKRGEQTYVAICSVCHNLDLKGGELAPSLTGNPFSSKVSNRPLGQFLDEMQRRMPLNSPGGLSRQQNVDILAYLLSKAQFPAGQTELPSKTEALNQIRLATTRQ